MKPACLAVAVAVAAPSALADAREDRQAVATLLGSSVAARTVVSVAVDECTARFPQLVNPALDAKMEWDARNIPLEERARMLANRLAAGLNAAARTAGYDEFRQSLLAATQADTARKVREMVARNLEGSPAAKRIEICRDLVRSVHEGKMDFAVTQPNAYSILENAK